jgi:hypothetical protein
MLVKPDQKPNQGTNRNQAVIGFGLWLVLFLAIRKRKEK